MKTYWLSLLLPLLSAAADWQSLPPLPDAEGFAGVFAGVSEGALLVAGGANFPDAPPWRGGTKTWYDSVFALADPEGDWQRLGRLPRPNGYGVSVTTKDGVICAGGGDADGHFREVFRLRKQGDRLQIDPLPSLPRPCALMAGAVLDGTLYLAGGIERPDATAALAVLWSLDLADPATGWRELSPCPGPARILAVMGSHDGVLHLFSGAALKPGPDGKPEREWLKDAWQFRPGQGWRRLADLPRVAVAAPGPVPVVEERLWVIGGDDGTHAAFEPKDRHPGFPRDVLAYDPGTNTWTQVGKVPFSLVTTALVEWRNRLVIPGGEARPGKRSPQVWQGTR
jgi:N-acetylneuraminate epimerase